ncbi:MAG: circularly permuted type 2 ATP-grasp protein [Opitutaceae bacterium]|jgi:uncharacterized circularly permuted ATP-grasp superfamily protein/uncharacterized alpha-E superfamily protein
MPVDTSRARLASLNYAGKPDRYDACVDASGKLRASWEAFFDLLGADPAAKLGAATEACHRAIIEQDVSMNIYLGQESGAQPWPLDAVPMLIGAGEWTQLTRGLRQRAHLLNELLRDLYGPQNFLREGLLPAQLVMANPHFLRACAGLGRRESPFLHTYAVDLARSPDGQWWVIEDRLDAPSGLGYSLQNRIIARQALPDIFQRAPVERLFPFFRDYRASLEALSPHRESAEIVFLSPGPANETYFEHAYLARYLGYTLVEGEDLITRNRQVYLRTVDGLKRTDILIRRVDSDFCDPLELDGSSLLGVPGLVQIAQGGQVALANQLGARVLETPALLAFLQPLCRRILGEELLLPSAATWWGGQSGPLDYILSNLSSLVVKPAFRSRTAPPPRYGAHLDKAACAALADEIRAQPWAWCGQERVLHGTTPGWHEGTLRPMPFITRFFLVWHDGDYLPMPGGLTRCNPDGEDMIVSLQQGSISKDVWVLQEAALEPVPINPAPARPIDALRQAASTPSRMADNFFWLGRYLERCSQFVRQLERLEPLQRDDIAVLDPGVALDTLRWLLRAQETPVPADATLEEQTALVRRVVADRNRYCSLASNLDSLASLLERIKVHLPPESQALVRQLRRRPFVFDVAACAVLRQQLAALEGITVEAMPRDAAWRFLNLGRRLERCQQLLALLRELLHPAGGAPSTEFRLQILLHFADSLFSYRTAFRGALDATAVLDWLFLSPENPRSLRYQIERINIHLGALPEALAPVAVGELRTLAFRMLSDVRLADLSELAANSGWAESVFTALQDDFVGMSNQLTQIYFTHASSR